MRDHHAEHTAALRDPAPGFERALGTILRGLAEYADAHRQHYGQALSEDFYIGQEWDSLLSHFAALLSGEHGRLDGGLMSSAIEGLRSSGGSVEGTRAVRQQLAPEPTPAKAKAAKAKRTEDPQPIGTRRLDDRQRELLARVTVESNVANYIGDHIPDWSALKQVMTALGGKWRARKGFVFSDDVDARETLRLAQTSGEIIDPRAAEFFETPSFLAEQMAEWIAPSAGMTILEPSAGRGALVRAVMADGVTVHVVEALEAHREILRGLGCEIVGEDFMTFEPSRLYDAVIMNPPFSRRQDVAHITRAISMLAPGGRLAAIASAGVLYRDDRVGREFRALVERLGGAIEPCPERSFRDAGTDVGTCLVRV